MDAISVKETDHLFNLAWYHILCHLVISEIKNAVAFRKICSFRDFSV